MFDGHLDTPLLALSMTLSTNREFSLKDNEKFLGSY